MDLTIQYANTPAGRRLKKAHAKEMRDLLVGQRYQKKRIIAEAKANQPPIWKGWGWKCNDCGTTTPTDRLSNGKRPRKPPYTSPLCDGCQKHTTQGKFVCIKMIFV